MTDEFARPLAEMDMPDSGVGTAWPTQYCPFCEWRGEADKWIKPENQVHEESCPVHRARIALGIPTGHGENTTEGPEEQ